MMFLLRIASLLASFLAYSLLVDLGGFAAKLRTRFPDWSLVPHRKSLSFLDGPETQTKAVDGQARALELAGEYSKALTIAPATSRARLRRAVAELNLTIKPNSGDASKKRYRNQKASPNLSVVVPITNSLPFTQSGYSLRTHELLSALSALGVGVHAITRPGYPISIGKIPDKSLDIVDGVSYHRNLPWHFPFSPIDYHASATSGIVALAKSTQANAIHTTSRFTNGLAANDAASQLSLPWIYEVRGREERTWIASLPEDRQEFALTSERFRRSVEQEASCLQSADHVVAISELMRDEFIDSGIPDGKVTVIPNGVDDRIFDIRLSKDDARARLGLPSNPIIGCISSLVRYEGIETLIRSALELPKSYLILIVGDGEDRTRLQRLANTLELNDRVIFAGKQPSTSIWTWYRALDSFAVPRNNTLVTRTITPIKPLAAQALRVPVIASDLPALREVTGGHAAFVQPESPSDLAHAIMEEPAHSISKGYKHAQGRTWSTLARRLLNTYERL